MQIDVESIYSFRQMGERDNQEDSRYPDNNAPATDNAVFVVCDGVGGCDKGEVASSTVCSKIGSMLSSHTGSDEFTDSDFRTVLNAAYDALESVSEVSNVGMGTTLTFVCFHSAGVMAAHIGDSRIYQFRPKDGIIYRSEDHSLVNALLRSGNISPDQVKDHPQSNVITRCMNANDGKRGKDDATVVNLRDIAPGDYILLCTDGVTGAVDEEDLEELYSSDKTDKEKYEWLSERCSNSDDNNTAIQIHIGMVTVDVEQFDEADGNIAENRANNTLKLNKKDDTVHEISASSNKGMSKIKSFLKTIFK